MNEVDLVLDAVDSSIVPSDLESISINVDR